MLDGNAEAGTREIRRERSIPWDREAVEDAAPDPDVVVEVLDMPNAGQCAARRKVQRRRRVRRERDGERFAQCVHFQRTRDAPAACCVCLEHVHGACAMGRGRRR